MWECFSKRRAASCAPSRAASAEHAQQPIGRDLRKIVHWGPPAFALASGVTRTLRYVTFAFVAA
jgi:hypothetical protein